MSHREWLGHEIAIIGMGFRLPGAASREEYWQNLRDGVESVKPLSASELKAAGVAEQRLNDPNFVSVIGRLDGVAQFDADFFSYSPSEAVQIDPQHRLFLECAWEAIEDAGYDLTRWTGPIGVFAGSKASSYAQSLRGPGEEASAVAVLGNDPSFLATTVSYKLNLNGPSINVQTACSTALVATFLAAQSLLSYQCDMALAGAASITLPQEDGYIYMKDGVMSPDGHCRAFDNRAQGAAPGNGVTVLLLKRLNDALKDRDHIHGIVRGIAINNDGAAKVGYTAPSVSGQAEVIAMALAAAQASPEEISYVETHGTGTPLGDTVELAALTKAFQASTARKQYCPIGSVKTNIGHTDVAAGHAGLIKTVLALQHEMIPPSLNFEAPNSQIDFANSPFYLSANSQPWKRGSTPRLAGVSAFGLGGTNAHAILEEVPVKAPALSRLPVHLLLLSARNPESLDRATEALAKHLSSQPDSNIADTAYTLQVGREQFEHRKAVLCRNAQEAVSALRSPLAWKGKAGKPAKIIFMFPGVGDHYLNMASELYQCFPQFRADIDRCSEYLEPMLGQRLAGILYSQGAVKKSHSSGAEQSTIRMLVNRARTTDLDSSSLHDTAISHCCIFVVEYALARLWMTLGLQPAAMIGYSLGEYVAACIAGVFSLEDALKAIVTRAKLVSQQAPGLMLAAALSADDACRLVEKDLALAAINAPELCVMAGTIQQISDLEAKFARDFVACRRLPVTRPLHSPLLQAAGEQFSNFLKTLKLNRPEIPYISDVTGSWITDNQARDPHYWGAHTTGTVRFSDGICELLKEPLSIFLEVGPGAALGSFVSQHGSLSTGALVLPSLPWEYECRGSVEFLLESTARLWLSGVQLDWAKLYMDEERSRVPLPTYAFARKKYWLEPTPREKAKRDGRQHKKASVADWLYAPNWKRSYLPVADSSPKFSGSWLIFANDTAVCASLLSLLRSEGANIRVVREGARFEPLHDGSFCLNSRQKEGYQCLADSLQKDGFPIRRILHFWTSNEIERTEDDELYSGFFSLVYLLQTFSRSEILEIDVISSGVQEVVGTEKIIPARAMVLPLCTTAPQEFTNVQVRHIDITQFAAGDAAAEHLLNEINTFVPGQNVAYRGRHRWVQGFESLKVTAALPVLRQKATWVITGGLGEIGLALAEYLARHFQARLVLMGRTALPERSEWQEFLQKHSSQDRIYRKISALQKIESHGAEINICQADVGDEAMMTSIFAETRARWGAIYGVIHAAGVLDSQAMHGIDQLTPELSKAHFHAKVSGTRILVELVRHYRPEFCILMSSLSTVLGGLGMSAYAAANQYMDATALCEGHESPTAWLSVDWDTWNLGRHEAQEATGRSTLSELLMTAEEGLHAFMLLLNAVSARRLVVSIGDLDTRLEQWVALKDANPDVGASGIARHPRPVLATPFIEPQSEVEKSLAEIWAEVLGIDRVGLHDNFFRLGGHSLMGIRVIGKVRNEFGIDIHVRQIFEHPTVAELALAVLEQMAELLEEQGLTKIESSLVTGQLAQE